MIYRTYDWRYKEFVCGTLWCEPDYSKLSPPVARLLQRWEEQMLELELRSSDAELSAIKIRLNLDCMLHTLSRLMGSADRCMEILHYPRHATDKEQIEHSHRLMIEYAKLYVRASAKYGERRVETAFMNWFRGACDESENQNTCYPVMGWCDMMNEFPLGAVMAFQLRWQSNVCYLPPDIKAKLISLLWNHAKVTKDIHDEENRAPLVVPAPLASSLSPLPIATPLSPEGGVASARVHDKGPRAPRWTGLRQRAGSLRPSEGGRGRPRSEEDKQASIAAGKARERALRAAEKARVEAAWERQRLVSLGFDIGQGVD